MQATYAHKDLVGRDITVGCYVAASYGIRDLRLCRVIGLTPKMISLEPINPIKSKISKGDKKYPSTMIVINETKHTDLYILKHS